MAKTTFLLLLSLSFSCAFLSSHLMGVPMERAGISEERSLVALAKLPAEDFVTVSEVIKPLLGQILVGLWSGKMQSLSTTLEALKEKYHLNHIDNATDPVLVLEKEINTHRDSFLDAYTKNNYPSIILKTCLETNNLTQYTWPQAIFSKALRTHWVCRSLLKISLRPTSYASLPISKPAFRIILKT